MVRLVVVALLWCAACADEYGGAGMPLYDDSVEYEAVPPAGNAAIDYRGHSPDAPAPLDYKYEEERQGNIEKSTMDIIESDIWKKAPRKQRGRRDRDESDVGVDAEPLSKFKSKRRIQRARSRLADDKLRAQNELARRRRGRQERSQEDTDGLASLDYLDKSDYRGDKNEVLDEIETVTVRETTERVNRRKPRLFNNYVKTPKSEDLDLEEELIMDRKLKEKSMERVGGLGGKAETRERQRYRPVVPVDEEVNDEEPIQPTRSRSKPKEFHDYSSDFYDMRRLRNIKKKLPILMRRTTTPAPPSRSTTTEDMLALWMAARRADGGNAPSEPRHNELLPSSKKTTTTTTITTTTNTPRPILPESTELSLAEKSRLSIFKKSQKKENKKGNPAKKPPILLHVTNNVPTIVMVEPPASTTIGATPRMRAQPINYQPPKNLEKVKRLMRHKLVAGAKNIKDLTDNWDDMVCDYIDESLINTATAPDTSLTLPCMALAFLLTL